jgi:hypothetical protein
MGANAKTEEKHPMTEALSVPPPLHTLVQSVLGVDAARDTLEILTLPPQLLRPQEASVGVSRAVFAMAMTAVLFHDLLARVPTGAAYVADVRASGGKVTFDHGALRTIRFADGPTGALPPGEQAFVRIFTALGYRLAGVYPLDRLGMTGRAYAQGDFPEAIPQFFLSELHVERFSPAFQAAAHRVFDPSRDPLDAATLATLEAFASHGTVPFEAAQRALPVVVAAFDRHHPEPALSDYELLLAESAEAAWIATEGCAFNHATDRVSDVDALAAAQRAQGRPIKEAVEVSGSGRVRQTAFKADPVLRGFRAEDGTRVERQVPGSFYEFISRDADPESAGLDLRFDASNAQGIFKMTAEAKVLA